MEKREPSYTVGGNANSYSHYEEQCGDSLKNWKLLTLQRTDSWIQASMRLHGYRFLNMHLLDSFQTSISLLR